MFNLYLYSESPETPYAPVLGFPKDLFAIWDTVYTMALNSGDNGAVCEIKQKELIINGLPFTYKYFWKSETVLYTNKTCDYEIKIETEKNCLVLLSIQGYLNGERVFVFRRKNNKRTQKKSADIYKYSGKNVLEEKLGKNANAAMALLCWWVMCRDTENN